MLVQGILAEVKLASNPVKKKLMVISGQSHNTLKLTFPRLGESDLLALAGSIANERIHALAAVGRKHTRLEMHVGGALTWSLRK